MKKLSVLLLVLTLAFSALSLTSCGDDDKDTATELKLGIGVYTTYVGNDAEAGDDGSNGVVSACHTVAAALIDGDNKIVKCYIDVMDAEVEFTVEGKAVTPTEFKTKREYGDSYGMVAYGGSTLEWYEQANAFADLCKGKTLEEVKALVASNGKGSSDVISAGCTIYVTDFALAIEKAFANTKTFEVASDGELDIGIVTSATTSDVSSEDDGSVEFESSFTVSLKKDGKVTAAISDAATVSHTFDADGKYLSTESKATKREQGDSYGMAAYGSYDANGDGEILEWYAQADALDAALIGKTADEIKALNVDGYATAEIQTAGCTIKVTDMVAAAAKAAE